MTNEEKRNGGIKVCKRGAEDIVLLTRDMMRDNKDGKLRPDQVMILRKMAKTDEAIDGWTKRK